MRYIMIYSKIEREYPGLTYTCDHNRLWLYERQLALINDNRALVNIVTNSKSKPPPRIERILLRLQGHNFTAEYVPSVSDISDYLSPHSLPRTSTTIYIEKHVHFTAKYASPNALAIEDIKTATNTNPDLWINTIRTNA